MTDILQDTRDRVIALAANFTHLEDRVAKNSKILEELHRLQTEARGATKLGRALWSGTRYALSGVSGGGFIVALQHYWPKAL